MTSNSNSGKNDQIPHSNSRLSQLINEYDLNELGKQLEEYWFGNIGDRYSLCELAEYGNQQLLRTVRYDTGMDPLDGKDENTYRLLIDDVSPGTRTQVRRRLQWAGVDVDQLDADFDLRQAVHTYLTAVRGVTYTADGVPPRSHEHPATQTAAVHYHERQARTTTDTSLPSASSMCCWICLSSARTTAPSTSSATYLMLERMSAGKTPTKTIL